VAAALQLQGGGRRAAVFCGHTHGEGTAHILPNLVVHTGGADYGKPVVQKVLSF
jgi:Icc protein